MQKITNLHEYVRKFKTAEKIALDKVRAEFTPDKEQKNLFDLGLIHEDRNKINLDCKIEDRTFQIQEQWIYGLFELIESKNPLCTREEAQTIANLLLKDFHLSKWDFLVNCVTGEIDR